MTNPQPERFPVYISLCADEWTAPEPSHQCKASAATAEEAHAAARADFPAAECFVLPPNGYGIADPELLPPTDDLPERWSVLAVKPGHALDLLINQTTGQAHRWQMIYGKTDNRLTIADLSAWREANEYLADWVERLRWLKGTLAEGWAGYHRAIDDLAREVVEGMASE